MPAFGINTPVRLYPDSCCNHNAPDLTGRMRPVRYRTASFSTRVRQAIALAKQIHGRGARGVHPLVLEIFRPGQRLHHIAQAQTPTAGQVRPAA